MLNIYFHFTLYNLFINIEDRCQKHQPTTIVTVVNRRRHRLIKQRAILCMVCGCPMDSLKATPHKSSTKTTINCLVRRDCMYKSCEGVFGDDTMRWFLSALIFMVSLSRYNVETTFQGANTSKLSKCSRNSQR